MPDDAAAVSAIHNHYVMPNVAIGRLHERLGFEKVAHFKRVGRKFDQWVDVGCWQLQLD